MNTICYYLCCGCCCPSSSFNKKEVKKKKMEKQEALQSILDKTQSKSQSVWRKTKDPLRVKTTDMTEQFDIPSEKLKTVDDIYAQKGYCIIGQIDSGSYGDVLKGQHLETKTLIAIKKITIKEPFDKKTKDERKREDALIDVKNELFALERLHHPHVITLIQHFMIRTDFSLNLHILMQLADGGNLLKQCHKFGPFDEKQCKLWFAQMLSGLSYMHKEGIAHRDLKCDNILLGIAKDVLISDFGLSRLVWRKSKGDLLSQTFCGTPPYMAPEVLIVEKKSQMKYNAFKADVWALGVILYRMFDNTYPFPKSRPKALKYMKKQKWKFSKSRQPSRQLNSFLKTIFNSTETERPTTIELQKHVWIEKAFEETEIKSRKKIQETDKNSK